ncbi:MAG: hypothetical protein A3J72_07870 [Nitrospirae bacterium RIFCSPHIGHO2_02_FULL_40_19]|nr:MAG: hypothetical protein A3J72_07870 [Nitrospirae bacterium RIFCSPHIGHO2_02_FULL_40_19]
MNKIIAVLLIAAIALAVLLSGCVTYDKCDLDKDGNVSKIETQKCEQGNGGTGGNCGDGVCGPVEKKKGICPKDCGQDGNNGNGGNDGGIDDTKWEWSSDERITNSTGVSSLSYNNAHPLAFKNGVLYLVWSDSGGGNAEIYFKYSGDYGATWSDDLRLTNNLGTSWTPSMAVGQNNDIHVVWGDNREGTEAIYYKYSSDGGKTWSPDRKISTGTEKSWNPDIAIDGSNVYIAWQDKRNLNGEIYFVRSTDGGKTFGAEQRITNASYESERPTFAIDSKHCIHLAWYDWRNENNPEIYYAESADYGQSWGEQKRVTNTPGQTGLPAMAIDGQNQINIAYLDGEKSGNMYLYYTYSSDGTNWQASQQKLNKYSAAWFPTIAYSKGSGLLFIAWQDTVDSDKEIFYTYSEGNGQNWSTALRLTEKAGDSTNPFVAVDDKNQLHIVWEDSRNGDREIHYKRGKYKSASQNLIFSDLGKSAPSNEKYASVNTERGEKAPSVSADGLDLYFHTDKDGRQSIYTSARNSLDDEWGKPSAVVLKNSNGGIIDTGMSSEAGPSISIINGKEMLFFSSDGILDADGKKYGSYDVYVSVKNSDGTFGQPKNLGSEVNTVDDELGPSLYYDAEKNKGIIFYAVGWKSNSAHKSSYLEYEAYLGKENENIWFNTFSIENGEFVFENAKFFKYNTAGSIEDNPSISGDGKILTYSAGSTKRGAATYGNLEYYGDFDLFYTFLENDEWAQPQNLGGNSLNSEGHEGNSEVLILNNAAYLFFTYSPGPPPYNFNLYDYYLGNYSPPYSSKGILDNLPEMG